MFVVMRFFRMLLHSFSRKGVSFATAPPMLIGLVAVLFAARFRPGRSGGSGLQGAVAPGPQEAA
jgi:hypothetical protein